MKAWLFPHLLFGAALALAGSCSFGYRAEAEFERGFDLSGVSLAYIELPETDFRVRSASVGDTRLAFSGRFFAVGGTPEVALAHAESGEIVRLDEANTSSFLVGESYEADGLIELELDRIDHPRGVDLSIHSLGGHAEVSGIEGQLGLDSHWGDLLVRDLVEDALVFAGDGQVQIGSSPLPPGGVDLVVWTGRGDVELFQRSDGDVDVDAGGDVFVELPNGEDLRLYAWGRDGVDVRIDTVDAQSGGAAVGHAGELWREIGAGTREVTAIARAGRVVIRLPPLPPED